jgi:predicted nucleotidyltransferase component of viral defense system
MDKVYADTVRLLLHIAPDVFVNDIFAMKGGTAINLFVRDMPRLSVDIDVVYVPWQTARGQALAQINAEVDAIDARLRKSGLATRKIPSPGTGETKLLIEDANVQVKVEVNTVYRGTVLPVERRALTHRTAGMFSVALEVPTLAPDELYGSKLVACLDRQHPRDLFDTWEMFETQGLTDGIVECFVTYLAGHNRPVHEVLFGNDKDIEREYHDHFVGMTTDPVTLETLLATRARLKDELPKRLTPQHKAFLIGLAQGAPDWSLLRCEHAAELPASRWKVENLKRFQQQRPDTFNAQVEQLKQLLG